eukprot:TRINITY_DN44615_c0_g1_i1.p1 TRINITY_DN44615_c0_g1~~TRINITY_DN44615_c0_g1_i1.p1  ORF type:complete len:215 (+),score=34.13 TRINITY_DN44615_c0_g1_i1:329-973(+)
MIDAARANAESGLASDQKKRVRFDTSIEQTERFHVVASSMVLMYLDTGAVVADSLQWLRPGGVFVAATWAGQDKVAWLALVKILLKGGEDLSALRHWTVPEVNTSDPSFRLAQPRELVGIFRAQPGVVDVRRTLSSFTFKFPNVDTYLSFLTINDTPAARRKELLDACTRLCASAGFLKTRRKAKRPWGQDARTTTSLEFPTGVWVYTARLSPL